MRPGKELNILLKKEVRYSQPMLTGRLAQLIVLLFGLLLPCRLFAQAPSDESCMECHGRDAPSGYVVDREKLFRSSHGDLSCTDCHQGIDKEGPHARQLPEVDCGGCHEDAAAEYKDSVHALVGETKPELSVKCKACHGTHDILPKKDHQSSIHPESLPNTCGGCHSKPEVIWQTGYRKANLVKDYLNSVHGRTLQMMAEGKVVARRPANCVDCHGSHGIYPRLDPRAGFNKLNVPDTCGKCHPRQRDLYKQSIHWDSVKRRGNYESPVCYDCHGEHTVEVPGGESHYSLLLGSSQICIGCHSNRPLMLRFGLDAERLTSYLSTYHGLAALRGDPIVAKCVSCHEVHDIRAQSDPASTVNPKNLLQTCLRCHEYANPQFVQISVHPVNQRERNPVAYWVKVFYLFAIVLGVGGMFGHNLVIFIYYVVERRRREREAPPWERFRKFDIIQHGLLAGSFAVLAITGFALKFPQALWVQGFALVGLSEPLRATLHRFAAVIMIGAGFVQVVDFMLTAHGRAELWNLRPRWSDITGFIDNMRFHLHLSDRKPAFARYSYAEKAEYLALVWGSLVMTITGFIMWFPEFFLTFLPVWSFEVAEVIHYYEALLAILAILVWHLFFVLFHPENYPTSAAWYTSLEGEKREPLSRDVEETKKTDEEEPPEGKEPGG